MTQSSQHHGAPSANGSTPHPHETPSELSDASISALKIVALAGGVGGAKLAAGLQAALEPGSLTVIVNTGDDFEHWGLYICPDLDTVLYNLAGIHNPETGLGQGG